MPIRKITEASEGKKYLVFFSENQIRDNEKRFWYDKQALAIFWQTEFLNWL